MLYCAAALSAVLFAGSCQRENLEPVVNGGVTYTITLPEAVQTKGQSGYEKYDLYYEVYKTVDAEALETAPLLFENNKVPMTGNTTTVTLDLLNDQDYTVLFWANKKDVDYFDLGDLRKVTAKSAVSNNNDRDAFCGKDQIAQHDGTKSKTVTLKRPFAQLNIATIVTTTAGYDVTPVNSKVTVYGAPVTYNVFDGAVSGETTIEYDWNTVPADKKVNDTYDLVAMNYVLVPEGTVDVEYWIETVNGTVNNTVNNVPVKVNYRTNIIGNLLTSDATYTVEIKPGFDTPAEEVVYWNGSEVNEPKASTEDQNVYVIEYPSELAWLAAAVNGNLTEETRSAIEAKDFAGKTFILTQDIDLNGQEWTPIGTSSNIFKGTFDGQGHTVKNLKISGNKGNVGLFGVTHDGEIKNLTVENAEVSGRLNVGVVAGQPYTSKYTNITVTGHVEVNGMAYVGAVGGKNAYADWTDITVEVDETSYVKANSVENGTAYRTYVGGVVGFNGEGGHSFTNITSNIDVEGSTCDVGGLFGIAHYGNKFKNCVCTGNVEIYAAEEAEEAEQIGGIAGVWHNENGTTVSFTDCSFEGTLKTNVTEGVDLSDNIITGAPYSATGTGKLVIDGKELYMVAEVPAEIDLAEGNTVIVPALSADHKVVVKGNGTLVLNGATITSAEGAAIELANGAVVTLRVNDAVTLTGAADGILVPAKATLLVKGAGNLTTVGNAGSGIAGSVEFDGLAHLTAKGNGDHAFGIGGNGAIVIIKNSTVDYACGGHIQPLCINDPKYGKSEPEGGAAIGGTTVKIESSTITKADGGSKAAAIGGQYWQSTSVEIVNSTIKEANGGNASAGIGGSRYDGEAKHDIYIKIQNSTVTATGGQFGAGIGAGYDTHCNGQNYEAVNSIEIDKTSVINAKGGKYAPGIGTGFHSAYLTGSIAEGAQVTAVAGDETFYKDEYTTAQNIGYGVVDPAREFSKDNRNITFKVEGTLIESPYKWPVAKVGNTEYTSIDEAIAMWENNTTLTLLYDVTLSNVITLKSTEYHILDLGTYTMTAAKGKDAISITAEGRSSASYALDIKADATNPGGITATSKAVVKTTGKSGVKDRPIIRFYNGVFAASNVISHSGSNGTNSPQFIFYNGVYNGNISTNRTICIFEGGTFNGKFYMSVDSSSYARIGGGKYKYMDNLYGSALNADKFTIGSAKGVFDRGVYVDDEGYIVVGGPVITEFGDKFAAKATNANRAGSYLPYSSAAEHGLYYTNAEMAIAKHGEANVELKK